MSVKRIKPFDREAMHRKKNAEMFQTHLNKTGLNILAKINALPTTESKQRANDFVNNRKQAETMKQIVNFTKIVPVSSQIIPEE